MHIIFSLHNIKNLHKFLQKISNLEVIGNETDGYIYYHENAGGEIEKSAFDNNEVSRVTKLYVIIV